MVMERFVRIVVAGGIATVAGLWVAELATPVSGPWLAGVALAALGVAGLGTGIWIELDY